MLVEIDSRDDQRDKGGWKKGYLTRFHELGQQIGAQGGRPFSSIRHAMMQTPTWSQHALPIIQETELDDELVQLLQGRRSVEALEFCQMLKLFHFQENRPLVSWGRQRPVARWAPPGAIRFA